MEKVLAKLEKLSYRSLVLLRDRCDELLVQKSRDSYTKTELAKLSKEIEEVMSN